MLEFSQSIYSIVIVRGQKHPQTKHTVYSSPHFIAPTKRSILMMADLLLCPINVKANDHTIEENTVIYLIKTNKLNPLQPIVYLHSSMCLLYIQSDRQSLSNDFIEKGSM